MLNLEQARKHVEAPQPGFLYEPRAFWDVAILRPPIARPASRTVLDSDKFYNGSKYPVVLTHLIFDPAVSQISAVQASRGFMDGVIRLTSSGNQPVTRGPVPLRSLLSGVSFEPPSPYNPIPVTGVVPQGGIWGDYPGPLWNVSQWDFCHPLVLPKDGAVTFSIGARIEADFLPAIDTPPVVVYAQFNEGGDTNNDFYKGNARSFIEPGQFRTTNVSTWGTIAGGGGEFSGGAGVAQPFPPSGVFTGRAYQRQNITQAGSTLLRGFSVMFDQRAFDIAAQAEFPAPTDTASQSCASRTPVKAKTSGCGTQESWWRDGAPLSLVSPTRTPALVGKLQMPITLQPGDGLDVELAFGTSSSEPVGLRPTGVNFGISLCGFAAIEA